VETTVFLLSKCSVNNFGHHIEVKVDKKICNFFVFFFVFGKKFLAED